MIRDFDFIFPPPAHPHIDVSIVVVVQEIGVCRLGLIYVPLMVYISAISPMKDRQTDRAMQVSFCAYLATHAVSQLSAWVLGVPFSVDCHEMELR